MFKKGELKNRVGEKFINNEGCSYEIIEYFGCYDSTIRFEDGSIIKGINYGDMKRGNVKNPFYKSIQGVGFMGVGKHKASINAKHTTTYNFYTRMMDRGYSTTTKEKQPSYKDCYVNSSWHNFQNFGDWFEKNYKPDYMQVWQLDKDILIKGNKVYSPETCCFVPQEINTLFIKSNKTRGKYPIGVHFSKEKQKFTSQFKKGNKINLGYFDTPEEAFQVYKTAKELYIKIVANKWKPYIDEKVYKAMINYQVEITD